MGVGAFALVCCATPSNAGRVTVSLDGQWQIADTQAAALAAVEQEVAHSREQLLAEARRDLGGRVRLESQLPGLAEWRRGFRFAGGSSAISRRNRRDALGGSGCFLQHQDGRDLVVGIS